MTYRRACADDLDPGRTVTGPRRTALPPVQVRADSNDAGRGLVSTALPLLTAAEEPVLGFWIEAGVLAASVLNAYPRRRPAAAPSSKRSGCWGSGPWSG